MNRFSFFLILSCLVFTASCAFITPTRLFDAENQYFTSDSPPLKVHFKGSYCHYEGKTSEPYGSISRETHIFKTPNGIVSITFYQYSGNQGRILDYWHDSDETLAKEQYNADAIDTVMINGKSWARVYWLSGDDILTLGYFKRKAHCAIVIARHCKLNHTDALIYQQPIGLSPSLTEALEKQFAIADKLYEIEE